MFYLPLGSLAIKIHLSLVSYSPFLLRKLSPYPASRSWKSHPHMPQGVEATRKTANITGLTLSHKSWQWWAEQGGSLFHISSISQCDKAADVPSHQPKTFHSFPVPAASWRWSIEDSSSCSTKTPCFPCLPHLPQLLNSHTHLCRNITIAAYIFL